MRQFELTILGCSSATPTANRNPTSQLLCISGRTFLIDCGEGTQMQLRRYKIKFQKIERIFISHLHGDHYLGLMGLLLSMHLLGRKEEIHLYCYPGLKDIIDIQLKHSFTTINFPLIYHFLNYDKSELIFEDEKVSVETILLSHRIPVCGFLFREKPQQKNIRKEKIEEYKIPLEDIPKIKKGMDFTNDHGETIPNVELTIEPPKPKTYAFCSDTCYKESIIEKIQNADLLYHEATFMDDMKDRAKETFHSTTIQAATIAQKAGVKKLLIGHYSARYKDNELCQLQDEAKTVFENTFLAMDGDVYKV